MPNCPVCGRPITRTNDGACPWCSYPLLSSLHVKIPRDYAQLWEGELRAPPEPEPPPAPAATAKALSVGLFIAGIALLLAHELSISAGIAFPPAVFWASVAIIIGSLVFQIIRFALSGSFANVILFEILAANFAFHMIYIIPYPGLYGGSPNLDWWALNHFLEQGSFDLALRPFPGFDTLNGSLSLVTGIDTFNATKYFPSLLDTFLILLLYLFLRSILKNAREALLAVLLFTTLFFHVWLFSTYHWEVLGIFLVILTLYLYVIVGKRPGAAAGIGLSVICLVSLIFSHHLSSLYVVSFLVIYMIVYHVLGVLYKGERRDFAISFVILAAVIAFAYYVYVYVAAIRDIAEFGRSLFQVSEFGQESYSEWVVVANITIRDYVEQYGFYAFHAIFALIILYNLVFTNKRQDVWYSFTAMFLLFWGAVGLLLMYVVPRDFGRLAADRTLVFGWLFGFAPRVAGILRRHYRWLLGLGISILVGFMFFGIYMISPIQWNPAAEQANATATSEEFALAEAIDFTGKTGLFSGQTTLMAIYNTSSFYNQHTKWHPGVSQYLIPLAVTTNLAFGYEEYPELDWVILKKRYMDKEKELAAGGAYYGNERAQELSRNVLRLSEEGHDGYQRRDLVYASKNLLLFR